MRKVVVGLVADVGDFVKFIGSAKKSVDELGDEVDELDHSLNKIAPDAAKAGAALKLLGGDVDSVGNKVNSLGEKNVGLALLDSKIKEAQKEVRKLADEFQRTGDIDIFKKLGDASGKLNGLQEVRKKLKDAIVPDPSDLDGFFKKLVARAEEWGNEIGKMLPAGIQGALANPIAGPIIAVGLLAALVAAIDLVMANIGGLVLAGAGLGVVGLGIMGAVLGDPEVVGARWKDQISVLKADFLDASTQFREPLLDAAAQFGAVIHGLNLDAILGKAATYVGPLVAGAAAFARWIVIAVEQLTNGAGPEMKVLAQELPKIGHAVAVASKSIADGSEGGAAALKDLLGAVEVVIAGVGGLIGAAEKAYGALVKVRDAVIPRGILFFPDEMVNLHTAAKAIGEVGDEATHSVDDLEALSTEMGKTAVTADSLAGAMVNKLFTATMNLDQAVLGVAESLTRLDEVMDKNGKTLDIHTAKGQANREAIYAAVTANMQLYQSQLSAGMSAEDAAAAYGENTAALERQLQKAHLTQGEIDGLIGKYRDIPKKVDTDIAIHGLTDAIDRLNETIRLINGIHDKTVTITVKQYGDLPRGQSRGGGIAHGGIRKAAEGLIVPPSDPGTLIMGEPVTGGEAYIPLKGISQTRAMSLAQIVGDNYGFSVSSRSTGHAEMRSTGQMDRGGGGGGMPKELVLNATFLDPMTGDVMRKTAIRWSIDRGRNPADFFTKA